jgi:hypothetical protein
VIEIEDLGDSGVILKNKPHLKSAAHALVRHGIIPTDDGWSGWLGRYQRAVVEAHRAPDRRRSRSDAERR